ncbi:MAG TPA: NfeD family protein [Streptosporangiaceae bacterium]|nr:NfeD family protein [Streptosporangiaceae bacterium]
MGGVDASVWWIVIAVALGIAEIFTAFLVFGMFAVGALAAAAAAALHANVVVQAVAFAVVSTALLAFLRPIARRHMHSTPKTRTGVDALIGQEALVVQRVDAHGGRVKIGGEIWSARALHPEQILDPGTAADVIEIRGATAVVFGRVP